MGNKITVLSGTGDLNTDNELGKFIYDWALNDYTVHPDLKLTDPIYKDQLKKRACTIQQNSVGIGLPGIDKNNNFVPHYNINIPVFNDTYNPRTPDKCKLTLNNINSNDTEYMNTNPSSTTGGIVIAPQNAITFYNGFCNAVKKNRTQYKETDSLYGPDPDPLNAVDNIANSYVDCNCANSFFKDPNFFKARTNVGPALDQLAQTLDMRCSGNLPTTYKLSSQKMGCLNYVNFGSVNVSDTSKLDLAQNCGNTTQTQTPSSGPISGQVNAGVDGTSATIAPVVVTQSPSSTIPPTASTQAPSKQNWYSKLTRQQKVGLWIVVAIIIIIIIVVLIISSISDTSDNSGTSDSSNIDSSNTDGSANTNTDSG